MTALKITIILLITIMVIAFIRAAGDSFHIASVLPFRDGDVDLYDWAGLAMAGIFLWGLYRLRRRDEDDSDQRTH